jgi:hypothetical protein
VMADERGQHTCDDVRVAAIRNKPVSPPFSERACSTSRLASSRSRRLCRNRNSPSVVR